MAAADQVVCPFFGVVFVRLSLIYKNKKLGPGLVKELKKLYKTFLKIKEVLDDAEEKQFNERVERVLFWLHELNDAAYDADDVFDEVEYEALHPLASEGANSRNNNVIEELHGKIQTLTEIFQDLAKECSELDLRKGKEKSLVISPERITMSLLTEPQVYGRDEDREKLVKQLLGSSYLTLDQFHAPIYKHPKGIQGAVQNNASSSNQGNISVFPIQGMGGLGKTTLAQLIYNDKRVENHYEVRCWVCVSYDFDTKRLLNAFLASVPESKCNVEDIEQLPEKKKFVEDIEQLPEKKKFVEDIEELRELVQKEVHGKRFLLVLDDVWEERRDEWNKLMSFLRGGAQSSSIIVTTRMPTVASITSALPSYCPSSLSERDCWALFKQYAFGPGNEKKPVLVKIGKRIVKKCHGLPLAAKALGGLLRFKNDENEWLSIKDSAIWEFQNDILPALRISYYHLSFTLKQCFVYCSIFPKDLNIEKEHLIQLWMANGLVPSQAKMDLEDFGNAIFNELLWRSFFQDIEKDIYGNIISCKMHNLVHDLASSIAGEEYFVKDVESSRSTSERTRHVCFKFDIKASPSSLLESMRSSSPGLRSLVLSSDNCSTVNSEFVFSGFILLRALDLHQCGIKVVPDCIAEMKHLRYLNLSDNPDIITLPKFICLLRNMQTLSLRGCHRLSSLPEHIENMRCLVHLDIEGCNELTSMPIGIGQLTRLRTLCRFILGKESGCRLDGLQELNNLRGRLWIWDLDDVETLTEAEEANLMSKKHLHSLSLLWGKDLALGSDTDSESRQQRHQNVVEGLQPHSNLREIFVRGYDGVTFSPSWLTPLLVPNLVEISLFRCTCEHLGSLRKLPRLKILKLFRMDSLEFIEEEEVDDASAGGFPSLEELILERMSNLEGWSMSSSSQAAAASAEEGFRWLEGLSLEEERMRNLEGSSSSSSSQAAAAAAATPTLPAAAVLPGLKSKTTKKLERCPILKRGGVPLSSSSLSQAPITKQVALFPCLKKVKLLLCPKLKRVPFAWSPLQDVDIDGSNCNGMVLGSLRDLPCLHSLQIDEFQELEYFPPGTLANLNALQKLVIVNCDNLKALPVELNNLATLTELSISGCLNLVSLADEREGGLKNLSSLKTLVIQRCEALKRLPKLEKASLVTLNIISCRQMEFSEEDFQHLVVIESLRLFMLPKLTFFPQGLKHSATTLTHLQFQPRSKHGAAVDLPDWIGTTLTSLEYLEIDGPKNWKVLPQWMQRLTALKILKIFKCNKELVERWRNRDEQREDNNSFNMVAHIPDVRLGRW